MERGAFISPTLACHCIDAVTKTTSKASCLIEVHGSWRGSPAAVLVF
jgi:hypothetical protein